VAAGKPISTPLSTQTSGQALGLDERNTMLISLFF
jgi:hypothetical protein